MNTITPETQYEKRLAEDRRRGKRKKSDTAKDQQGKNKNNGEYPVYTIALFNESKISSSIYCSCRQSEKNIPFR